MFIKKLSNTGLKILQGNEACSEGAIAAGCQFFAGYPITPASEIAECMATRIPQSGGTFLQMEDEIGSINAIIGARWGGRKAMTATSGPGFSLMQEGLGYGIITETPIVIINVQRGGPSTGQPTSSSQQDIYQAKYGSHGDYELIAYAPSSVQEMFDFTVKAFNQAEKYRVPVIILADEIIGHMRERILIPEEVKIEVKKSPPAPQAPYQTDEYMIPPAVEFFQGHNLIIDGQLHDERGLRAAHLIDVSEKLVKRLSNKLLNNIEEITDLENYQTQDASLVVISYGSVARTSLEAVKKARSSGLAVGFIKVNTVWPFPEKRLQLLTKKATSIIVPEMNMGKYYREIRGALRDKNVVSMPLVGGNIHKPIEIYNKMREVLENARVS
jgi:2-oxoglutarate ferredoxin oxidoreductase subunit alpha